MPTCFKCDLTVPSVTVLHTHLKISHNLSKHEGNDFRCAEGDGCYSSFSGWGAYRVHLIRRHNCPQLSITSSLTNVKGDKNKTVQDHEMPSEAMDICTQEVPCSQDPSDSDEKSLDVSEVLEDTVLEFAAKLYANHKLPRSHVVEVMKDTSSILVSMLDILKPAIRQTLKNVSNDELECVYKQLDSVAGSFSKLSSEHMYLKALKKKDQFIGLQTYVIGSRVNDVMLRGEMVRKLSDVTAKFIPMRIVLQKFFNLPQVFSTVMSYLSKLQSEEQLLENFVQGKLWRQKVKNHFQGKIVFPLFIYFDDFEVNNVLGSHTGIQKLGAVYYSIPCLPPQVQSLLDNIFVAALFHSSDRADFTNHNVFDVIIQEINFLQSEGILIHNENGPVRIFFSLGLILGDNLGLNQILGFQEGFNAQYPCRFCKTSKLQMQWETSEARLRTPEMYNADVAQADPKSTGVKEKSVWDNVQYFETSKNFAVDFLHDGPEGAFKKFMALIVHHFSFSLKCTAGDNFLTVLNDRLNSFDCYHSIIKNRPPPISFVEAQDKHLKMSASEMQTFILIFSMLVGDIIPRDDEVWQFYLCMRRVLDVVLARRLQKDCVTLLKGYVGEMYEMYLTVFPNESVTFKIHNFVHYYTVYDQSGPLVNLSTYRFESKHKDKKTEANATCSRKNILETLCHKELLCLAHRFILGKGISPNDAHGKGVRLKLQNVSGYSSFKDRIPHSFLSNCKKLSWVKVSGQLYRKGSCVVTKVEGTNEILPVFGVIDLILRSDSDELLLVCKSLLTLGFSFDYFAYEVESTNSYDCVLVHELVTPFPAIFVKNFDGSSFVTLRHAL